MAASDEWMSLWPGLLRQSAQLASPRSVARNQAEIAAASAIILARTSLEAFLNEFIEWRRLSEPHHGPKIPTEPFLERLRVIARIVATEPNELAWPQKGGEALNRLRNLVVHFDPGKSTDLANAQRVGRFLVERSVIPKYDPQASWQRQLLCARVAQWSCNVVSATILSLEGAPFRKVRSTETVERLIASATARLIHNWKPSDMR